MATTLLTAKEILLNYDILSVKDREGKKVERGTAYEFQDYAYRLASDLNDLEHLMIYMKFAKTLPKYVLEQAYQFVADSNTDNKSRLFMWKVKKLRAELQKKKDIANFNFDHVNKKMREYRNTFAKNLIRKNDENNFLAQVIPSQNLNAGKIQNLLFVGSDSVLLPYAFISTVNKIFGIDPCKALTNILKKEFVQHKKAKFITKDFFKNSYKDFDMDLVIVQNFWNYIPQKAEKSFFKELYRLLKVSGMVLIGFNKSELCNEKWQILNIGGNEFLFFDKKTSSDHFESLCLNLNFEIINSFESDRQKFYLLRK